MTASRDFAPVGYAYGQMEAALACAMLEAAGIIALQQTRYAASNAWHFTFALGGIPIVVPASQRQEAIDLLADFALPSRARYSIGRTLLAVAVFLLATLPPPPSGYFAIRHPAARSTANSTGRLS